MRKVRFIAAIAVSLFVLLGFAATGAHAARPVTAVTLTATDLYGDPYCSLTAIVTLDASAANAIKGGGHVDFVYYVSGGAYSHDEEFTNTATVTKRVKSVVDGPLNYGFSSGPGFAWEVDAIGYDSQSTELFRVSSDLVPIPLSCP